MRATALPLQRQATERNGPAHGQLGPSVLQLEMIVAEVRPGRVASRRLASSDPQIRSLAVR